MIKMHERNSSRDARDLESGGYGPSNGADSWRSFAKASARRRARHANRDRLRYELAVAREDGALDV